MEYSTRQRALAVLRLAVTLGVTVAAGFGLALDADAVLQVATCAATVVAFLWSWWKNNNISTAAIDAQALLQLAKGMDGDPATTVNTDLEGGEE